MVKAPQGAVLESVDDHQCDHCEQDHHDRENRNHRDDTAGPPEFLPGHLAQRLAVAPHGAEQHDEILHRPANHGPQDDPERAGEVAELRGQRRSH